MTIDITNEEAIEQLDGIGKLIGYDKDSLLVNQTQTAIQMAIKSLETRWIPVSEKLPKDGQRVLITTRRGNLIDVDTCIFHHASAFWEYYVIAWMPLPEPYKVESKN